MSINVAVLERTKGAEQQDSVKWAEADVEDIALTQTEGDPIVVEGDKLEINSSKLEVHRIYTFDYLGVPMVAWKSPDGAVDLYQLIEE